MALEDSNISSANALSPIARKAEGIAAAASPTASVSPTGSATPPAPPPDDKTVISKRPPIAVEQMPSGSLLPNPAASLAGTHLEHYELGAFVGGGGMGSVYRATD